jgi:hypothetical protein
MSKTFNTAVGASDIVRDLFHDLRKLPYNRDLYKLCHNIDRMVTELSKLEVYTRRTPPRSNWHIAYNKKREEIHNAIKHLDNLILMLRLMS